MTHPEDFRHAEELQCPHECEPGNCVQDRPRMTPHRKYALTAIAVLGLFEGVALAVLAGWI